MTAAHEDHAFPFVEYDGDGKPAAIETGMTLRQYAAIKLRVPNSGTDWLDDMVRESLRDELAAKAMPACYAEYCTHANIQGFDEGWKMGVALDAYAMADAMLNARELDAYAMADAMLKAREGK